MPDLPKSPSSQEEFHQIDADSNGSIDEIGPEENTTESVAGEGNTYQGHGVTEEIASEFARDENYNLIPVPKPTFSKKESTSIMQDLLKPNRTKGFKAFRRVRVPVLNLFYDIRRYFGYVPVEPPKREVHFTSEIIEEAEKKGDIAGKDRYVPLTKQNFRRPKAGKNKKKPAAQQQGRDQDFNPRLDRVQDTSELENWCEKTRCCKLTKTYRHSLNPSSINLANVTEGFMFNLNKAETDFLHSHKTITIETTVKLVDLGGPETPTVSESSDSFLQNPLPSSRIGRLSSAIWAFTYCIQFVVENDDKMNESAFQKLMDEYNSLSVQAEEATIVLIEQAERFSKFVAECQRVLRILNLHLDLKVGKGNKPYKPLQRGDGLRINKTVSAKKIAARPKAIILVSKTSDAESPKWADFRKLSTTDKMNSLWHLLQVISEEYIHAVKQINLLVDDVVETYLDDNYNHDFLSALGDLYERTNFMVNQPDSGDQATQIAVFKFHMPTFTESVEDFAKRAEHIMLRVMEFRDMLQVTDQYLEDEIKVETTMTILDSHAKQGCCCRLFKCNSSKNKKTKPAYYKPKYSALDFFRVYYEEAFSFPFQAEIFSFQIRDSADPKLKITDWSVPTIERSMDPIDSRAVSIEKIVFLDPEEKQSELLIPILKSILVKPLEVPEEVGIGNTAVSNPESEREPETTSSVHSNHSSPELEDKVRQKSNPEN